MNNKYKLSQNCIIRDDGASIPMDEGNRDYREYLEWVGKGNEADLAEVVDIPVQEPSLQDQISAIQSALIDLISRT